MRVIAGTARRLELKTIEGRDTRPTTDRIKETLFNILQPDIYECRFLDLFAGSGGIGIEALSRGAREAVFVENNRRAARCIEDNLWHTHLEYKSRLILSDVISAIRRMAGEEAFDLIFMDPPYAQQLEQSTLRELSDSSLVGSDTVIIVEALLNTDFTYLPDMGFEMTRCKAYKTNEHVFIRRRRQ